MSTYPPRIAWSFDALVDQVRGVCVLKENTGCWEWTRATNDNGYGRIRLSGRLWLVHRAVLYAVTGELHPATLHSCDNPPCCNPDHLSWGDQGENMRDASVKGRTARMCGARAANAKLTQVQVDEIRTLYAAGRSQRSIARQYGTAHSTIRNIVHETSWKRTEQENYVEV